MGHEGTIAVLALGTAIVIFVFIWIHYLDNVKKGFREACATESDCDSSLVCAQRGANKYCLAGIGHTCIADSDCGTGSCQNGTCQQGATTGDSSPVTMGLASASRPATGTGVRRSAPAFLPPVYKPVASYKPATVLPAETYNTAGPRVVTNVRTRRSVVVPTRAPTVSITATTRTRSSDGRLPGEACPRGHSDCASGLFCNREPAGAQYCAIPPAYWASSPDTLEPWYDATAWVNRGSSLYTSRSSSVPTAAAVPERFVPMFGPGYALRRRAYFQQWHGSSCTCSECSINTSQCASSDVSRCEYYQSIHGSGCQCSECTWVTDIIATIATLPTLTTSSISSSIPTLSTTSISSSVPTLPTLSTLISTPVAIQPIPPAVALPIASAEATATEYCHEVQHLSRLRARQRAVEWDGIGTIPLDAAEDVAAKGYVHMLRHQSLVASQGREFGYNAAGLGLGFVPSVPLIDVSNVSGNIDGFAFDRALREDRFGERFFRDDRFGERLFEDRLGFDFAGNSSTSRRSDRDRHDDDDGPQRRLGTMCRHDKECASKQCDKVCVLPIDKHCHEDDDCGDGFVCDKDRNGRDEDKRRDERDRDRREERDRGRRPAPTSRGGTGVCRAEKGQPASTMADYCVRAGHSDEYYLYRWTSEEKWRMINVGKIMNVANICDMSVIGDKQLRILRQLDNGSYLIQTFSNDGGQTDMQLNIPKTLELASTNQVFGFVGQIVLAHNTDTLRIAYGIYSITDIQNAQQQLLIVAFDASSCNRMQATPTLLGAAVNLNFVGKPTHFDARMLDGGTSVLLGFSQENIVVYIANINHADARVEYNASNPKFVGRDWAYIQEGSKVIVNTSMMSRMLTINADDEAVGISDYVTANGTHAMITTDTGRVFCHNNGRQADLCVSCAMGRDAVALMDARDCALYILANSCD